MSEGERSGRQQVLLAALLFSTAGAAIKATALSSWQVAGFRSGVAAFAIVALLAARGGRSWRGAWRAPSLLVGSAYASTMILFVASNKLTTAANTIFLQSTAPLYVMLLAPLLLRERMSRSDLPFAASLLLGLGLFFVGSETPAPSAPDPARGNLLAVLAGLTWALTLVGLRWLARRSRDDEPDLALGSVVAGNLIAFAVCLPLALGPDTPSGSARDWLVIAYLGVFQIGLAYIWMTRGVRRLPALEVSLLLLLEPVLNPVITWLVHGEQPGTTSLAGCAVILVATAVRTLRPRVG